MKVRRIPYLQIFVVINKHYEITGSLSIYNNDAILSADLTEIFENKQQHRALLDIFPNGHVRKYGVYTDHDIDMSVFVEPVHDVLNEDI